MNLFDQWRRRHLAADPQEPASPPPSTAGDRVVVSSEFEDAAFITGTHGKVIGVEFTTDPEDEYGPWIIWVLLDGDSEPTKFAAQELTRETGPAEPSVPLTVFVKQPEDTEPPAPHGPATPTADVAHWVQRAKELRHERISFDTPIYDDVNASAMAADGLAAEVSAYLAQVAGGAS